MSLLLAGSVGVFRDLATPSERIVVTPRGQAASGTATFTQLVVAQIPAEALLAYTTLLALFSASTDGYRAGRWVLYGVSLPICGAVVLSSYIARRSSTPELADRPLRHLPWFPMATAVVAMGIYGLSVPGSALQQVMSPTGFAITAGCLSVGGGILMSIFAPFLGRGNGVVPDQPETAADATGSPKALRAA